MTGETNKVPAKISALLARSNALRLPADFCAMGRPVR
jgi:hypothetical protein